MVFDEEQTLPSNDVRFIRPRRWVHLEEWMKIESTQPTATSKVDETISNRQIRDRCRWFPINDDGSKRRRFVVIKNIAIAKVKSCRSARSNSSFQTGGRNVQICCGPHEELHRSLKNQILGTTNNNNIIIRFCEVWWLLDEYLFLFIFARTYLSVHWNAHLQISTVSLEEIRSALELRDLRSWIWYVFDASLVSFAVSSPQKSW